MSSQTATPLMFETAALWTVVIGKYYIFHIDPEIVRDDGLEESVVLADRRHPRIVSFLLGARDSPKWRERTAKINYWFHRPTLPAGADAPVAIDAQPDVPLAAGWVASDGIHFGVQHMSWLAQSAQMMHEEAHAVWGHAVGEAPSLLNEGVAVWAELRLTNDSARDHELHVAWHEAIVSGICTLRALCDVDIFWEKYRAGVPVYGVAGALTGFLWERTGPAALRQLFRATHYRDERFPRRLESLTRMPLEDLSANVTQWLTTGQGQFFHSHKQSVDQ